MSVNGAAGANNSPVTGQVAALSRDVFAGLITSIVAVAYGLSFAALIFAPPLTPWIRHSRDLPDHGNQRGYHRRAEFPPIRHRWT
jgi:hypothetical protein